MDTLEDSPLLFDAVTLLSLFPSRTKEIRTLSVQIKSLMCYPYTMVPIKNPICSERILNLLWKICDAIHRKRITESLEYTIDALLLVVNEEDWCFHTDATLPSIHEFLQELCNTLASIACETPDRQKILCKILEPTIQQTLTAVTNHLKTQAQHLHPISPYDAIERKHRITQSAKCQGS